MHSIRKAADRGHTRIDWLDSNHSFSFGHYYDPRFMGFGPLRVINDDIVAGGGGFATHPHANMEIISYVVEGALAHRDSLGNGSVIVPGDVQRMTAGTGVRHSEENDSQESEVHFLQIWLLPSARGIAPGYAQKHFADAEKRGRLRVVASPDARDGSIEIHAEAVLHAGLFAKGERETHALSTGRHAWVHVVRGSALVNGEALKAGDAMAVSDAASVTIEGDADEGEVLLFDLA